jgi:3-dehydroquinate synthase
MVRVELGPRAYDVVIGRDLLDYIGELVKDKVHGPVAIISDNSVASLFAYRVEHQSAMTELQTFSLAPVPVGEPSKSMEHAAKLLSDLAAKKVPRSGTIIGLGGGVVGDLAGFVAASYLRGVVFIQVPTTLLAMVDSSVGGKTGVNLPEGKNLVGAFYQPKLVVIDLTALRSLSEREFAAGMAEVIKYGAIKDKTLFDRVAKGVKPDDADLDEIVEKCVAIKARIVENDEFETKGERALLNFGHTIGHAIEKATEYKTYLHGEAISLGMRAAAWLSVGQAGLPEADARRIEAALTANHLPVTLKPEVDCAAILAAIGNDKKVAADGRNRWVLLKKLGEAEAGFEIDEKKVETALNMLLTPISEI